MKDTYKTINSIPSKTCQIVLVEVVEKNKIRTICEYI